MRRLVVELSGEGLSRYGEKPAFEGVKSMELLHFLKQDPEEIAAIVRLQLKNAGSKVGSLVRAGNVSEVQVLEKEKDGAFIAFMRWKPIPTHAMFDLSGAGGFLFTPIEIRDGKIKLTFLGNVKQVKEFLKGIESGGVTHRILSLTDAKFSPDSPLSRLTEKQRTILTAAYKRGYYDLPRKIESRKLAQELKLGDSTVVEHLRKAERRLLTEIFNGH